MALTVGSSLPLVNSVATAFEVVGGTEGELRKLACGYSASVPVGAFVVCLGQ